MHNNVTIIEQNPTTILLTLNVVWNCSEQTMYPVLDLKGDAACLECSTPRRHDKSITGML